jgi:hypothetical protein
MAEIGPQRKGQNHGAEISRLQATASAAEPGDMDVLEDIETV